MRVFFSLTLFGLATLCIGQINTDRPTQSFSPYVLPHGKVQTEFGFLSEKPVASGSTYNVTYLNALLRVGVTKWFELRASGNYLGERTNGDAVNDLSPVTLGTKIHINDQSNGLPQTGLLFSVTLPAEGSRFGSSETVQDIRLMMQEDIGHQVTVDVNFGTFWSKSQNAVGIYTLLLAVGLSDHISVFAEPYGFFSSGASADTRFNFGGTYLVNDKLQLDASAGVGLSKISPDYFISTGLGIIF